MVPDRRNRIRPHLSWPAGTAGNGFSPKGGFPADPDKPLPRPAPPSGRLHGRELADTMRKLEHEFRESPLPFHVASARRGLYLIVKPFLRAPDKGGWFEVPFKRLEIAGAEVVASPTTGADGAATWFVPERSIKKFIEKFEAYTDTETPGNLRNCDLVDYIAELRRATLRALWTGAAERFPDDDSDVWWEVWLRRADDAQELDRLRDYVACVQARMGDDPPLAFGDRTVVLVRATARQLAASLDILGDLAELRPPAPHPRGIVDLSNVEQVAYAEALERRTTPAGPGAVRVCILDSGVTQAHPLLVRSLEPGDMHAARATWGSHDELGHGTWMAGIALYGDIRPLLVSGGPVALTHRLESSKIFRVPGRSATPQLWGGLAADGVAEVESHLPARARCFGMAVNAPEVDAAGIRIPSSSQGLPTSWSGAMDALASGLPVRQDDPHAPADRDQHRGPRRLIVVSAGNAVTRRFDYLSDCRAWPIEDPAQAWNTLTVGAYTEMDAVDPTDLESGAERPVAETGQLAPHSSTSCKFLDTWPIKPEVLFEGGNKLGTPGGDDAIRVQSLSLITTARDPGLAQFQEVCGTSPATMLAARMAAQLLTARPDLWPETIRALLVHSARWTDAMKAQGGVAPSWPKAKWLNFHRVFGYGVPDLRRALYSADNAVTLTKQAALQPFVRGAGKDVKYQDWHEHTLPWPAAAIAALGEQLLSLRVTLSYFVDPHPVRVESEDADRYASCGLRFDVKRAADSTEDFLSRKNMKAGKSTGDSESDRRWLLGPVARHRGSLHQDVWTGRAADLAAMDTLVVYPVHGWWRHGAAAARIAGGIRYALVVSIESVDEAHTVDLYDAIEHQVHLQVELEATPQITT